MILDYRRLVLNLRSAGGLSGREISELTGIPEVKISRMAAGGIYKPTDSDMVELLDCHLDYCKHLHDGRLFA